MSASFIPYFSPPTSRNSHTLWFVFQNEEILLDTSTVLKIPQFSDISLLNLNVIQQCYLGIHDNRHCYASQVSQTQETYLPANLVFQQVRQSYATLNNEEIFLIVTRAMQILYWDKSTRFCGFCGNETKHSEIEQAKICLACQALFFPKISPVMLVLIWRDDEILLARSFNFAPEVYSILAGFVEVGETLEQCVAREVTEEVGIRIKNLQYFSSQPWPFPSNLMLGFMAEYDGGDIQINQDELEDARWFSIKKLPALPRPMSLSRQIIDAHLISRGLHDL